MVILSNANRIKWLLSVALKSFIGSPLYPQAQIQTLWCGPNSPFHMGPGSIHVYLYTFVHIFPLPEIILCPPPFLISKFTCSISRWAQAEGESLVVKSISMLLVLMLHVGVLKPWWDSGTARGLGANYSAFWTSMSSVKEESFYKAPRGLNEFTSLKCSVQWQQYNYCLVVTIIRHHLSYKVLSNPITTSSQNWSVFLLCSWNVLFILL